MVQYAPELIAAVRHRYEETDQPMPAIAAECGMSLRALHRMVEREGWSMRSERPPRTLPPAARLLEEARALAGQEAGAAAEDRPQQPPAAAPARDTDQETNDSRSAIDRLEALVMKEIAAEEATRAELRGAPRSRSEARDVTRNLSTLTQTLQTLRRMRAGEKTDGACANCRCHDDDFPEDIDAFRDALADRIDAFVRSRMNDPEAFEAEGGETGATEAQ